MKYLIFSDTHLSRTFEKEKFDFLKKIICQADRVVINGDFWEGTEIIFDEFVKSPWNKLFPYFKSKHTIYVYGNHDPEEKADKRVELFSDIQTKQFIFYSNGKKFIVEHGDRFNLSFINLLTRLENFGSFLTGKNLFEVLRVERLLYKILGVKKVQGMFQGLNQEIKKQASIENGTFLICGHTHSQELDIEHNFANTGIVRYGVGQFIIVENGIIQIREENY